MKKIKYTDQVTRMAQACAWLGIDRGRAAQYGQLVREFFEEDARSSRHILALGESCEVVDLFNLWEARVAEFPGLAEKMKMVLGKGPLLSEEESPAASSNRPRNDAFGYLVAGWLLAAGVPVVAVDGINARGTSCLSEADVTFRWNTSLFDIECKRPRSYVALEDRAAEARAQLERPSRQGRHGVIAIDCSVLVRPAGTLLESGSGAEAEARISRGLETSIAPRINSCLTYSLLGFLLFARVPAMIRVHRSPILGASGELFQDFRPDSISTWLVVTNAQYTGPDVLRDLATCLLEIAHGLNVEEDEPSTPSSAGRVSANQGNT